MLGEAFPGTIEGMKHHTSYHDTDQECALLIAGAIAPLHVVARRRRPWDHLVTGLRSTTLDRELAAGCSADAVRIRALRADQLVTPAHRRRLGREWQGLVARAHSGPEVFSSRVPLRHTRVLAAEHDILALADALRSPLPVPARGVALAQLLLTDGSGPLYSAGNRADLGQAVRDATRHLDPFAELAAVG
jgi:hypothetical protein